MRTSYLLKNGCVLSMDARIGQYKRADVLIQDSLIMAVQPDLDIPDAEVIDASSMIIMPGLVDTHRHVWESLVKTVEPTGRCQSICKISIMELWEASSVHKIVTLLTCSVPWKRLMQE